MRSWFSSALLWRGNRLIQPLPLASDQYGLNFSLAAGSILVFTAVGHWSLTAYKDVGWFAGEDGASEWWSVATYLAAALLAGGAAWRLRNTGHPRLGFLQSVLVFGVACRRLGGDQLGTTLVRLGHSPSSGRRERARRDYHS